MKIRGNPVRGGRWLPGAILAVALGGCASGPAPQDHFYRLEVGAPGSPLSAPLLAGTLEVDRPRSDALTGQLPVLYREAGKTEIRRHSYHRWADPPTIMVQDQLIGFLREAGAAEEVVTPAMRVRPDFLLTSRIGRLERVLADGGAGVTVELELGVTGRRGQILLLRSYREERSADGPTVAEAVSAFSQALTRIFERFLADLEAAAPAQGSGGREKGAASEPRPESRGGS